MESELRLHDFGDFLRIGQVESHIGKSRVKQSAARIVELSALSSRAGILGIESRQRGKRGLSVGDSLCVFAQLVFHSVDFFWRHTRLTGDDLHLYLRRNEGDAVLGKLLEVVSHVCR